jgi:hypothetical protein
MSPLPTLDWGTITKNEVLTKIENQRQSVKETRASTQKMLAKLTALGYFILLGIPLCFLPLKTITVAEATDLIKTIAAVLGGIVGMIWIFYFKIESQ